MTPVLCRSCTGKDVEHLGSGFEISVFHHAQCGAAMSYGEFAKILSRSRDFDEGGVDSVCRLKKSPYSNEWLDERDLACFRVAYWSPPYYIAGDDASLTQAECEDACHKLAGRGDIRTHVEFLRTTRTDGFTPIRCQAYE